MLKKSYLCIVEKKDEEGAVASEKFVSGLQNFTACPARKNGVRKSAGRAS